jgi:hypothetical protein
MSCDDDKKVPFQEWAVETMFAVLETVAPVVIVFLILAVILLPVLIVAAGSGPGEEKSPIVVVEQDGHLFVYPRYSGGILHHPDCPCGRAEEEQSDQSVFELGPQDHYAAAGAAAAGRAGW